MSAGQYASIRKFLRGRFRPLEDPDAPLVAPGGGVASSMSREDFLAATTLPESAARFLAQMDMKLDALLAARSEAHLTRDFPHEMEIHELSASALVISTQLPLAPDDHLEVCFQVTHPLFTIVSGAGRILRRRETAHGIFFDMEFTRLNEDEQEKIIRFVFNEERKALRRRLESAPDDNQL